MREDNRPAPSDSDREELALCFRVLGWLLLALDWIIVVFVPIGFKEGSMLWAWWFGAEAVIGIALVVAGYVMGEPVPLPAAAHHEPPKWARAAAASTAGASDAQTAAS